MRRCMDIDLMGAGAGLYTYLLPYFTFLLRMDPLCFPAEGRKSK